MSEKLITVILSAQVKVGARWLKDGEVEVTPEELAVLEAEGVIVASPVLNADQVEDLTGRTFTAAEWEAAVAAEAQKLAGAGFDGELAKIEAAAREVYAASAQLEIDRAKAIQQRDDAVIRIADLEAQVASLTAQIEAIQKSTVGEGTAEVTGTAPAEAAAAKATKASKATAAKTGTV